MQKKIIPYSQDIFPVICIITLFCIDISLFFSALPLSILITWAIISIIPKAYMAAFQHNHNHLPFFGYQFLNIFLDILLFFQTGMSGGSWALHHNIQHHRHYRDQTKDPYRWLNSKGKVRNPWWNAFIVLITIYPRTIKIGKKHPKENKYFVYITLLSIVLLGVLFFINALHAVILFVFPMVLAIYLTAFAENSHHIGIQSDDHFYSTKNNLNPISNFLTGNLGYHTVHHLFPNEHWSTLPDLHKKYEEKIPENLGGTKKISN
jgi:fatty acid desaturase